MTSESGDHMERYEEGGGRFDGIVVCVGHSDTQRDAETHGHRHAETASGPRQHRGPAGRIVYMLGGSGGLVQVRGEGFRARMRGGGAGLWPAKT